MVGRLEGQLLELKVIHEYRYIKENMDKSVKPGRFRGKYFDCYINRRCNLSFFLQFIAYSRVKLVMINHRWVFLFSLI